MQDYFGLALVIVLTEVDEIAILVDVSNLCTLAQLS